MAYQVLLFYKYITIEDPQTCADWVKTRAQALHLQGRVLIAEEGINATLEGEANDTEAFCHELKQDPRFSDITIKRSVGTGKTFPKLSVKVRAEIVGTQLSHAEADPRVRTAPHLPPEQLRAMYEQGEKFIVLDLRNSYEFASGHFKGSIDPGLRASRDLKQAIVKLAPFKDKKIVTVCTGGVRCEKMSAYLLNQGFKDVSQLENGIHGYMEKYPGQDFLGTLYTFDERVLMDFGGERNIVGSCRFCASKTEQYTHCQNDDCHLHMLACAACVRTHPSLYCSTRCKARAVFLTQKKQGRIFLEQSRRKLRRYKRITVNRALRLMWSIRSRKEKNNAPSR